MRPKLWPTLGLLLALAPGGRPAAGADDDASKKLTQALQGTWQVTSRVADGDPTDPDIVKHRTLVFAGDSYTVYDRGEKQFVVTYKVDAGKKPALLDTSIPGESDQSGILKLDGDTLTVCFGPLNGDRATEFKSPKGKGWLLLVYKRVKK